MNDLIIPVLAILLCVSVYQTRVAQKNCAKAIQIAQDLVRQRDALAKIAEAK